MQPTLAPAPHSMRTAGPENAADQSLREHLLAQVHKVENLHTSSSASPHDQNIDPAIAGTGIMSTSAGESGGDDNGSDGKKGGKRELSTSKRAAQNRAAQRAFRQRKEGHIKHLEAQVKDYSSLSESFKAIQAENYQLRDYIISLQSRLIESQGDFPQPPSNIEIHHPRSSGSQPQHIPAPTAPMGSSAVSQLQASAAQAVADLGGNKHQHEEAAYLTGNPPAKRARMNENADMRPTMVSQFAPPNSDPSSRPVAAS
ncbi:hypothetical protein MMC07_001167 [Pseudocyphellaria aurata]|nr:hypothetical protein [Pseudocyphellaria aurata]